MRPDDSYVSVIRFFLAVLFLLLPPAATALDNLALDVASIKAQGWALEGIHIELAGIAEKRQQLSLTIDKLALQRPFDDLNLVNVRCHEFVWRNKELWCKQGQAQVQSRRWRSPTANFTFHIKEQEASFSLAELRLFGGRLAVTAAEKNRQWQVRIDAVGLNGHLIHALLPRTSFDLKNGKLDLELEAVGSQTGLLGVNLSAGLEGLTLQSHEGLLAAEDLKLSARLNASNHHGIWRWRGQSRLAGGGLYVDPVYLDAADQAIELDAEGDWNSQMNRIEIKSLRYDQAQTGELTGTASLQFDDGLRFNDADLSLRSKDLERLFSVYIKPFLEQTAWDGASLNGNLEAHFAIAQKSLTGLSVSFDNIELNDDEDRLAVSGGAGTINWANDETYRQPSRLAWRHLRIGALPMGAARLSFLTRSDAISLLEKIKVAFLGGSVWINRFDWKSGKGQDPSVYFEGGLNQVSLEQLSRALKWAPLSGTISGSVPGVEYRGQTLKVGGELLIHVFDGLVEIGSLAVSGLFSEIPVLTAEIEMNNLDMEQITRHFEFGGITGRLSGFIKNLTLEKWQPVSFFAWLGSPDDDDSPHKISQKAVKNIASIGGGGASDLISRSVLNLFETFGYDKLGIGCYLHHGVCQLMGLEARGAGYSIIKGGGIPRIDVIGYNSEIDWNVLIERLKRITASDEVIIQ